MYNKSLSITLLITSTILLILIMLANKITAAPPLTKTIVHHSETNQELTAVDSKPATATKPQSPAQPTYQHIQYAPIQSAKNTTPKKSTQPIELPKTQTCPDGSYDVGISKSNEPLCKLKPTGCPYGDTIPLDKCEPTE